VADIMAEAPRLADALAQRPGLLDGVLTAGFFAPLPDREGLAADLANQLAAARDYQETLDALRRWTADRRFQIGVQLLRRDLEGLRAGAALADTAEVALAALLAAVESDFARQHGRVAGGTFAVVGMGRLGSREMSLSSDLDLILIYDAPSDSVGSNGPRALAVSTYYARLSQRLIGAITAPTAEGRLYEVDMRLRPSGEAGPIATSLDGFIRYQRESAWTWEHMALTRARPVAGDPALRERLAAAIADLLRQPRDPRRLLIDLADMRRRIAEQHPRPSPWDLRHRRGGVVDLEFVVQYLLLRHAAEAPQLLDGGAADRIAALGAAAVLPAQAAEQLGEALELLRHIQALLALLFEHVPQPEELTRATASTLARCAGAVDFAHLDADITAACARVRGWYERLVARPARRLARQTEAATGARLG
ncbi:MAG TPA: glutamine-synthetase adenylyltransferase, partial [Stellaceae bacterium]|nr:glutamine-synthetase adenylyltransferase [Stellaceae bacterium]